MTKKKSVLERALEALGDQAMTAQALANKVQCERGTIVNLVRTGKLVKVGETVSKTWNGRKNPQGQTIVAAPEHAEKHRGEK